MEVIFKEDELRLLAIMHAGARAFDLSGMFVSREVAVDLGWDQVYLEKVQSYLAEWKLIAHGDVPGGGWANFHLTGIGENFMRHMERELRAKKVLGDQTLSGEAFMELDDDSRKRVLDVAAEMMNRITN